MHLSKLELFGFKSFADKTTIHFDRGVTCIVGPNGCGKSNISDAIRWVLGERSAKMLRGSKMEDVVFNGTDFRKPLGMAEVSLTIDNEDRGLPIDYAEVTLSRRLYRSGESEYLINKTQCRLKDIQDLILDTGIGSSSYSMIEQGKIDYILNADPDARRFLIEEAAGISKYKVKKEEALRKLERTEDNVLRLNDIIQEVQKNIQYAERQAKRAEKYKEQFERLKDLETRKAFRDLTVIAGERSAISENHARCESEKEQIASQKNSCRLESEALEQKRQEVAARTQHEESHKYQLKSELDRREQQLKFNEDQRMEFATRRGQISQEEKQLEERLEKNAREIAQRREDQVRLSEDLTRVQTDLAASRERLGAVQQDLAALRDVQERERSTAFELASRITAARNDFHRQTAFLETSAERLNRLQQNLERFQAELKVWSGKYETNTGGLQVLRQKSGDLERSEYEISAKLAESHAGLETLQGEIKSLEKSIHEGETRLEMLRELDQTLSIDMEALRRDHTGLELELIKGIRDIVRVRPGYEQAAEAALGDFSKFLIARDSSAAAKLVEALSGDRQGLVGLLVGSPVENTPAASPSEVTHPLIECALASVIEIDTGYAALLEPFLTGTFVARYAGSGDIPALLELSRDFRIVTREGFSFTLARKLSLKQGVPAEHNLFQRANEIEQLLVRIRSEGQAAAARKEQHEALSGITRDLQAQLKVLETEKLDCKIANESLESVQGGITDRLQSYQQEIDLIRFELEELRQQRTTAEAEKARTDAELADLVEKERSVAEKQEACQRVLEQKEEERSQTLREAAELESRFKHLEERGGLIREALTMLEENDAQARERIQFLEEEKERIAGKFAELAAQDQQLRGELTQLGEEINQVEVSLSLMRTELENLERELNEKQAIYETLSGQEKELETRIHQSEMKVMDLGYQERNILDRLQQTYHIELSALKAEDFPLDAAAIEGLDQRIGELRQKVESIGTVNLLAIEEYDELKKRYDFLMVQKLDMEKAREELLEAIRKINRTTKGLFETTFATVGRIFNEYYKILFQGGDAKLVLVDESQPLESGIDIFVRPPGKKLQSMTLLSGGEKALTAIALLCALFRVRPSPFCVMDEVDAPLDEANVDRFLSVVRTFLEHSQFILVTHNRKTIAMGDSLYGVTMEEAGVSKLVSVKVNQTDRSSALAKTDVPVETTATTSEPAAEQTPETTAQENPISS